MNGFLIERSALNWSTSDEERERRGKYGESSVTERILKAAITYESMEMRLSKEA